MARRVDHWLLGAAVAALVASSASAATAPSYSLTANGVTLEVSAPRADIVRIRAGHPGLPEDASWAVLPSARAQKTPLEVAETAAEATLTTSALSVTIDKTTLHVTVKDRSGRSVLDDAAGAGLAFGQGGGFRLKKAMPADAHYFGLGDKAGPLDRRGGSFTMWNTDAYGYDAASDPLYKSIPFVLGADETGHAFGLLVDDTWRSNFDFGKAARDVLEVSAEGGPVDYYVMAGPDPKAVTEEYAWLTGPAPLAPEWALGFQQSRYSYETEARVREIAGRLRADRLPADVLYLDIDYQDRNRPFTVNGKSFPDLKKLVGDLKAQDFRVVLITDLHIADAPDQGYVPYDTGAKLDAFLKAPGGGTYVGEVWPGPAVFPDFSRAKVRGWWGGLYKDFVADGVAGFWNDMNEPAIFKRRDRTMPLDTVHHIDEPGFASRDASHAEMHNVYGMLNSEATYQGLLQLTPDQRPFVLTRATYAGGQRYAATWTGDNSSTWGHLKLSTAMLVNLGLSGFAYSGDDIGGFAGDQPSADLLTRWIEVGAFNPIFRDHAAKGKADQEPWVGGAEHEAIRRQYIEARYRLMPYLYGLAEDNSRAGLPIMRPVFLEYPTILGGGDMANMAANQFMLGPDLMIAPPGTWESPSSYPVVLPGGGWFDYWTGRKVATPITQETPRLDRLPVFVRPGSIIPRQPLVQSTMETPKGPLELAVYPGPDCKGSVYLDDGTSFAYRKGAFLRQGFSCSSANGSTTVRIEPRKGSFKPWWTGLTVTLHGWAAPAAKATLDGKPVPMRYNAERQAVIVDLSDVVGTLVVEGR
ncbi:glycoside hydrolase family 31 protein [Phenylobacterium montanum]|uniref:Glycoside hydrolase family 31 protein n=1 Tax=Phenylobacterium montanum TaxID=2823693 RepID=A0A975FY73_9CAUL|nr:glycoside hydrolase family 31 protein [Caulobacter sp. S6]QUD87112.1 glycoside hydrolase family 31 protein [Caulobacter sp. S6]